MEGGRRAAHGVLGKFAPLDDEVFALEDIVADYIALGLVTAEMASAHAAAAKLLQLVRLSEGIASDGSFARQARRKFV